VPAKASASANPEPAPAPMNAPIPAHLAQPGDATSPTAAPPARDPYNYTSFSDREIVMRLLGGAPGSC
jgi:hypothetical protein